MRSVYADFQEQLGKVPHRLGPSNQIEVAEKVRVLPELDGIGAFRKAWTDAINTL